MPELTITKRVRFSEQILVDILTTAMEGGINYWAVVDECKWEDRPPSQVYAAITDLDEGKKWLVSTQTILDGLQRLAAPEMGWDNDVIAAVEEEDYDASFADNAVQMGLFGVIVYG